MVARAVCPLDPTDAEREILDMLGGLVLYNEQLYLHDRLRRAPWDIRWVPDVHERCVVMHDIDALRRRGRGSCGELAAAYAGYLRASGDLGARVELTVTGENEWHAVALASDGRVYDPATIGAPHGI